MTEEEQAKALKAKFDALGVAIRAGVTRESAAAAIGLEGLDYVPGAMPITLKLPGDQ